MSRSIESVACVASTPAQAKVFVATLMAHGIPARVDGDNLADEWAASRRLLNMLGTQVMVPTPSLARAREVLQPAAIDADELERQALATEREEAPIVRATDRAPEVFGWGWLYMLAFAALVCALIAWLR